MTTFESGTQGGPKWQHGIELDAWRHLLQYIQTLNLSTDGLERHENLASLSHLGLLISGSVTSCHPLLS